MGYKIIGVGKGTRVTYDSLDEVKRHSFDEEPEKENIPTWAKILLMLATVGLIIGVMFVK